MNYIFDKLAFDIQYFGAGDVVNYAGDGVANAAGGFNVNDVERIPDAYEQGGYGDLAPEIKEFYNTALLKFAQPELVHEQFGMKQTIPGGNGSTVEFRYFDDLPKALTPITEGVTPTGKKLKVNVKKQNVEQYGDYVQLTDRISLVAVDNVKNEAITKLSEQAARTFDTVVRNELQRGLNVMYAPVVSGGTETEVESRLDITPLAKLRVKDVFKAAARLKAVNAPKINGDYIAIIHPYVAYDLMQEAGDTWMDIQKYTNNVNKIFEGEIGKLGGVRFVESTEAKVYAPVEIADGFNRLTVAAAVSSGTSITVEEALTEQTPADAIKVWIDGVANTITDIDVVDGVTTLTLGTAITATVAKGAVIAGGYQDEDLTVIGGGKDGSAVFTTLFMGKGAYGVIDLAGGGLETIVKPLGYGDDPLNQRSSMGWKGMEAALILKGDYLIRYESGSEFSGVTDSN